MKAISKFLGALFLLPAITSVSSAQITGAIDQEWAAFFGDLPDPASTGKTFPLRLRVAATAEQGQNASAGRDWADWGGYFCEYCG